MDGKILTVRDIRVTDTVRVAIGRNLEEESAPLEVVAVFKDGTLYLYEIGAMDFYEYRIEDVSEHNGEPVKRN